MADEETTQTTNTFPSFRKAMNYRGGFNKFIYEKLASLSGATGSSTAYDDTALKGRVSALESAIGDENTTNSILARIKALEEDAKAE